jgi:hypothetical protein
MRTTLPDNFSIHDFFEAVITQNAEKLKDFFEPDALVFWANTNEQFTVEEYIRANCEYPGTWRGRIEEIGEIVPSDPYEPKMYYIAIVSDNDSNTSRVVGRIDFGNTENALIQCLVEYWSDISNPPEWRTKMNIGKRYLDEA